MRLKGKSAIVTGAASGIGRAIAKKFATEGAHLVTADIDGSTAETVAEEIRADGGTAHSIATDITKRGDVYAMTDTAIDYFGKVDVLVNNAGSRIVKPILDHSEDDWQRMLDVNLTGHFHCCQASPRTAKSARISHLKISARLGLSLTTCPQGDQ